MFLLSSCVRVCVGGGGLLVCGGVLFGGFFGDQDSTPAQCVQVSGCVDDRGTACVHMHAH